MARVFVDPARDLHDPRRSPQRTAALLDYALLIAIVALIVIVTVARLRGLS